MDQNALEHYLKEDKQSNLYLLQPQLEPRIKVVIKTVAIIKN
jgi:hypothetical protein